MVTERDTPTKDRAVTRAEVARYAGVSTAVVSYVINNGPRAVAPSTAARVHRAIELLDYRPNVSAQALRRGTAQVLGLIVLDPVNPFFTELRGRDGARRVGGIGLPLSAVRDRPGDPAVLRV